MKSKINCNWIEDMAFEAQINEFSIKMDASPEVGGKDLGPRPKPLTLASLGGCTGMDVISILKKMKVTPGYFNIEIEAELTEEHPKYYHKIHLEYQFKGEDLPLAKLQKAVSLSQEKYCGVNELLKKGAIITYEVKVLD